MANRDNPYCVSIGSCSRLINIGFVYMWRSTQSLYSNPHVLCFTIQRTTGSDNARKSSNFTKNKMKIFTKNKTLKSSFVRMSLLSVGLWKLIKQFCTLFFIGRFNSRNPVMKQSPLGAFGWVEVMRLFKLVAAYQESTSRVEWSIRQL